MHRKSCVEGDDHQRTVNSMEMSSLWQRINDRLLIK